MVARIYLTEITITYTYRMFQILSTCNGGGYKYCRTDPPHPKRNSKNLYPLHRVVMENKLGRLLISGEEVHHRDENKSNNSPDNLEVLTKEKHSRLHSLEKAPASMVVVCAHCKTEFSIKPYRFRLRASRNKNSKIYCSRACGSSKVTAPPPQPPQQ